MRPSVAAAAPGRLPAPRLRAPASPSPVKKFKSPNRCAYCLGNCDAGGGAQTGEVRTTIRKKSASSLVVMENLYKDKPMIFQGS